MNICRSLTVLPIHSSNLVSINDIQPQGQEKISISSDSNHQSKKWQYLWPRWSTPELGSISATTAEMNHLAVYNRKNDEEHTLDSTTVNAYDATHDKLPQLDNDETKKQALISLCKSLMLYGAPCHRIEDALEHVSDSLSVNATFIFIPGIMMMTFSMQNNNNTLSECSYSSNSFPQTILVRCPQGFDMGKLSRVNDIIQGMCTESDNKQHLTVKQSLERLNALFAAKPTWNPWITLLSHTLTSMLTAPVMFNATLIDTALSGGLGFLVGLFILLSERYTAYCNIFEISTTILISFITKALDQWVCFTGVVLSATSIMIPGYTLTMSIMELSARHVITGTIRFVYSMIYALFIGYGLEIGTSLYEAVDSRSSPSDFDVCTGSVPPWVYSALFPFLAISMSINLGATVGQWPSMVCCSAIGFGVSVIMSKLVSNSQIVGTISAFSVGLFGNLYYKVTGELAVVPLSCGIASLVPGSIGIQGAYFLIHQDDQGISFATQMVVASLGISVGLFAATLAVSNGSTKKLTTAFLSY